MAKNLPTQSTVGAAGREKYPSEMPKSFYQNTCDGLDAASSYFCGPSTPSRRIDAILGEKKYIQ